MLPEQHELSKLHVRIVRTTSTFRYHPGDILRRILDVTGLAVHTVGCVDLEAFAAVIIFHDFVHTRRAVALSWLIPFWQVHVHWNRSIGQFQMCWLVFFMYRVRYKHRR